jgi:inhibitor of cysteine peptidase
MRRPRVLGAIAFTAALALGGCAARAPSVLAASDSGRKVELARGDELVVSLEANPTTGFRWEMTDAAPSVLVPAGAPSFEPRGAAGVVGAGGLSTWRFHAERAGQGVLRFAYRRPFEPGGAPAREVHYDIVVR